MGAIKSKKCSAGHRMAGDNLYFRKDGSRECRKCAAARQKARRKRLKNEA
jgi:hypothetical protein